MTIEAARTASGDEPVEEYLGKLEKSPGRGRRNEQYLATILIRFEDFANFGTLPQPRELNYLEDNIWEIKAGVPRLPFFYFEDDDHGKVARLTSGFTKAQEKAPRKEINKARWVRDQDPRWSDTGG